MAPDGHVKLGATIGTTESEWEVSTVAVDIAACDTHIDEIKTFVLMGATQENVLWLDVPVYPAVVM